MVKLRVEVPPVRIDVGLNPFIIVGASATLRLAEPVLPWPPLVEVTLPVVLFFIPTVVPVMLTTTVQVPLAGMVPPLNVSVVSPAVGAKAPPQEVLAPGVAATCNPDGSASVNPTPVSDTVEFGFIMVNVSVVVPLSAMLDEPNDLLIEGGATTVMLADALLPVPPFVEVTLPDVLFFTPAVVPVTSTITVQVPLGEMVPPLNVSVVSPAFGAKVPPQEVLAPGVAATCNPEGSASVNPTPLSDTVEFGFIIVKVSVVVPPTGMVEAPNPLLIDGGPTTVMLAEAVLPWFELVAVTFPLRLFFTPALVLVMLTETVQVPLGAIEPPLKLSVVSPAFGANVPPQEVLAPGVAATCNPDGSASVNPTPLSVVVLFGFIIVNVSVVVPFSGMVGEPNPLLIEGGPTTVSVAVLLVEPAPLSVELITPVLLLYTPVCAPVTVTLKLHEPFAASDPPLNVIVLELIE